MRETPRLLNFRKPIQEHFIGQGQVLPDSLAKRNAHRDFRIEIIPLVTADLVAANSPSPSPQLAPQQEQRESKHIHLRKIKFRIYGDEPSKADNLTDIPVFDLAKPQRQFTTSFKPALLPIYHVVRNDQNPIFETEDPSFLSEHSSTSASIS